MSSENPKSEKFALPSFMQKAVRNISEALLSIGAEFSLEQKGMTVVIEIIGGGASVTRVQEIIDSLDATHATYKYVIETGEILIRPTNRNIH